VKLKNGLSAWCFINRKNLFGDQGESSVCQTEFEDRAVCPEGGEPISKAGLQGFVIFCDVLFLD